MSVLALLFLSRMYAAVWYVVPGATVNTGTSWATATSLNNALNQAVAGDQVWLSAGTYIPLAYPNGCTSCASNIDYTFLIPSGVEVYGGFNGTETALSQRDAAANRTILSGNGTAQHVVTMVNASSATLLDGLQISGGQTAYSAFLTIYINGTAISPDEGGGIYARGGAPVIRNCYIVDNIGKYGAGISAPFGDPVFQYCVIANNSAGNEAGGARLYNNGNFLGCTICNNFAPLYSNIFFGAGNTLTLTNTIVWSGTIGTNSPPASTYAVTYSTTPTNISGTGNSTLDPLFLDMADGNGPDNLWRTADDGLQLKCGSPARNTGNNAVSPPTTDMLGTPRIQQTTIDKGAYELADMGGATLSGTRGVCPGSTAMLKVAISGGVSPFTVVISDGISNQTISNYQSGDDIPISGPAATKTYTLVSVTGRNTCTASPLSGSATLTTLSSSISLVYVNDDATGLCDGSSWANAFTDLQYALESSCLATSTTVWVAGGTYKPSKFPAGCTSCGDFTVGVLPYTHRTFALPKSWQLYGGFAGTEATLADRTLATRVANPSVITGANHPNGRVLHLMLVPNDVFPATNSRVNGFIFEEAGSQGYNSDATIGGKTYEGADGGGVYAIDGSPVIEDCIFRRLTAWEGGGIRLNGGNPVVQRCVFEADTVRGSGGGLYAQQTSSLLLESCVFVHNQANYFAGGGGAICIASFGGANVNNCTFYQNTAYGTPPSQLTAKGAAIYMDYQAGGKIRNSILWQNTTTDPTDAGDEEIWRTGNAITTLLNTTIRDSLPMTWVYDSLNNDYGNPQFLNPSDPNGADNLWFTSDDGLQLAPGSPCINTGTNVTLSQSLDLLGKPRISQTIADRGAYEFTGISSAVLGGNAAVCPGDLPFLSVNIVGGTPPYSVVCSDGMNSALIQNYHSGDSIFVAGPVGTVYSIIAITDSLGQSLSTISGTQTVTYKSATRVYVAETATGASTGQTWADAFTDLQDAFDYECMAAGMEIWVAEGTYKPSVDPLGDPSITNGAARTFLIPNGVHVLGGFAGTETSLSQRTDASMVLHPTVLSGAGVGTLGSSAPDAYHVVMMFETDSTTHLDGLTITKGKANGMGMFPYFGTGWAGTWGGGMYIKRGNPVVSRCLILDNNSYGAGGGIALDTSAATFEGCVFSQNTTQGSGGAATIGGGAPSFINCVITGNIAGNGGTLTANGGAINAQNGANIHINTCTVSGNDAAGASSKGGGCYISGAALQVKNSIFWNNVLLANAATTNNNRKEIYNDYNQPAVVVSYSLIKDVFPITDVTDGGNNISSAPNFANAANPRGADTLWRTADDGLALGCSSPALNIGSNALNTTLFDIAGNTRVNGSAIDLGAYEQGGAASSAGTAQITTQFSNPLCAGATANVQLALTGAAGPYNIVYAANGTTYTLTNIPGSAGISFTPTINDTLKLVSVQAANGCLLDLVPGGAAYTTYPKFDIATLNIPTAVCAGSSGTMMVVAGGGTSPYTVVWTGGTISNYISATPISFTPSSAIQYTLSSVTDANGCAALALAGTPASVAIVNGPSQAVISGSATSCQGSPALLNLSVTGGAPPYAVVYAGGGGGTLSSYSGSGTFQVTPTGTTTYTLVSVTDANGCTGSNLTGSATVSVSTAPPPTAANIQVPTGVCAGGTANLVITITGGTPPYSVVYPGGTLPNYTSGSPIPVTPTVATTYSISGVIDANGCATTNVSGGGLMQIYPNPTNAILSGIDTVCTGDAGQISLIINGGTPPFTVVHSAGTVQNYTPSVLSLTPTTPTTYSLVSVTDANGCVTSNLSGSAAIVSLPAPVPGFTSAVQPGRVVQFTNTSTNTIAQGWTFGDPASGALNVSTQVSPSHTYTTTGTFTVILGVVGCKTDTLSQTVNVINVGVEGGLRHDLMLYPNPAGDQVYLLLQHPKLSSVTATLADVAGKEVLQQTLPVGVAEALNISQLPAGIYLLSLRDGDTLLQTVRLIHK